MDALILLPILLISCIGFAVIGLGVIEDSKVAREKLLRKERREIVDAIMAIKPMASSPDVRDTKNQIIDAITKRNI